MDDSSDNQHVRSPDYWISNPTGQSDTRGRFHGLHSLSNPWEERSTDNQAAENGSAAESDVELERSKSPYSRAERTASYVMQCRSTFGHWTQCTDHSIYGESRPPSTLAGRVAYDLERLTRPSLPPDNHPQAATTLSLRPGPRPRSPTSAVGSGQGILSTPPSQRPPATSPDPLVSSTDDSQLLGSHTQLSTPPSSADPTGVDVVTTLRLPNVLHDERHLATSPPPSAIGIVVGLQRSTVIQKAATELRDWLSSRKRPAGPRGYDRPDGATPGYTDSLPSSGAHGHPSQNAGGLRKKRTREEAGRTSQDSGQDSDGSEQERKRGRKPVKGAPDRELFACPFAKRYPEAYGQRSCAKTGWPTPHRTK